MQARGGVIPSFAGAVPRARAARALPAARPGAATSWSFGLLLLFLVLLYASVPHYYPQLEKAAPTQTVAIAALAVLFLEKWLAGRPFRMAWPETYLLFAFVVAAGLSIFGALWSRYAAEQTIVLLKIVAVYVLVVNTVDSWRRLRLAMGAVVVGGLFPAIGSLLDYSLADYAAGERASWVGLFLNPNELAFALVLLLPLAFALASGASFLGKLVYWGAALAFTAAILLSFSRGGLFGLWMVALLSLLLWGSTSVRIVGALVLSASLVFAASFWTRGDTGGQVLDEDTVELRLATIKAGAAMLADRPIFGVGLGCSVLGWPLYAPPDTPPSHWLHTHNTLVQVFTETGVIGGTVFLLLLGATLHGSYRAARRWRERRRPDLHRLLSALQISLVGFLVCGLTGGYLLLWFPYLILGFASAARLITEPPRRAQQAPRRYTPRAVPRAAASAAPARR